MQTPNLDKNVIFFLNKESRTEKKDFFYNL